MNSNVSLFVDKSVNDLRFTSIAHKDEKSKDHFSFGIGQNGDVVSFDGSSENKSLENVHIRNVKLQATAMPRLSSLILFLKRALKYSQSIEMEMTEALTILIV